MIKTIRINLLYLLLGFLFIIPESHALLCNLDITSQEHFEKSDVFFFGRVTGVYSGTGIDECEYTSDIELKNQCQLSVETLKEELKEKPSIQKQTDIDILIFDVIAAWKGVEKKTLRVILEGPTGPQFLGIKLLIAAYKSEYNNWLYYPPCGYMRGGTLTLDNIKHEFGPPSLIYPDP